MGYLARRVCVGGGGLPPMEHLLLYDLLLYDKYMNRTQLAYLHANILGAQWLSSRVLDSRPRGRGFEPQRRHCVVVLEQDTFILA